jgi:polypeptide N-acetylgalactosaminyltransferase
VSLDRSLPDLRPDECRAIEYNLTTLPKASVVIIFTDEAWTPLIRTIHSVINRTPPQLLHEVLLVDDYSQRGIFSIQNYYKLYTVGEFHMICQSH